MSDLRYRPVQLSDDSIRRLEHFLELSNDFAAEIEEDFPPSRERSLALTSLDELVSWLTRAVAA